MHQHHQDIRLQSSFIFNLNNNVFILFFRFFDVKIDNFDIVLHSSFYLGDTMKQTSTINKTIVMVAVLFLFTGASVGASIEEFAAPIYAEEDPYQGAIDDTTDEKDWRAIKSNDKDIEKGAKNFFTKIMPDRMDDRLEDRISHLEERIEVGQEIVIAYQFCIDSEDCEVDATAVSYTHLTLPTKRIV